MLETSIKRTRSPSRPREILEAALQCFEELGYEATTVEDIRRRASASVGSIYHHFGSKAGVAAALYMEGTADYQMGLLVRMQRARTARSLIRGVAQHHLDWAEANPSWARYLLNMRSVEAVAAVEVYLRGENTEFMSKAMRLIRPYMDQGEIVAVSPDVLIALLFGPAKEFISLWLAGRTESTPAKVKKTIAEAAWRSVQPRIPVADVPR